MQTTAMPNSDLGVDDDDDDDDDDTPLAMLPAPATSARAAPSSAHTTPASPVRPLALLNHPASSNKSHAAAATVKPRSTAQALAASPAEQQLAQTGDVLFHSAQLTAGESSHKDPFSEAARCAVEDAVSAAAAGQTAALTASDLMSNDQATPAAGQADSPLRHNGHMMHAPEKDTQEILARHDRGCVAIEPQHLTVELEHVNKAAADPATDGIQPAAGLQSYLVSDSESDHPPASPHADASVHSMHVLPEVVPMQENDQHIVTASSDKLSMSAEPLQHTPQQAHLQVLEHIPGTAAHIKFSNITPGVYGPAASRMQQGHDFQNPDSQHHAMATSVPENAELTDGFPDPVHDDVQAFSDTKASAAELTSPGSQPLLQQQEQQLHMQQLQFHEQQVLQKKQQHHRKMQGQETQERPVQKQQQPQQLPHKHQQQEPHLQQMQPAQQRQQDQDQHQQLPADRSPTPATLSLHGSSESLMQAEAEAARLARLLAPPVYTPPVATHQLASQGRAPQLISSSSHPTQIHPSMPAAAPTTSPLGTSVRPICVGPSAVEARDAKAGASSLEQHAQARDDAPAESANQAQLESCAQNGNGQILYDRSSMAGGLQQLAALGFQHGAWSQSHAEPTAKGKDVEYTPPVVPVGSDLVLPDR